MAERRPVRQAVVRGVGFDEVGEPPTGAPVEAPRVGDRPGDRGAVAAHELGERVQHDVGAPLDGPDQVRGRHRVVDHQRDAVIVRDGRDAGDVEHVVLRVRHRLAEEGLGVRTDRRLPLLEIVGVVDEGDLDAQLGQRVVEQVVGAAIQRGRRHEVAARLGEGEDRQRLGRLAGGHSERARQAHSSGATALERVDPGLEHSLRGVHDPGVDVADLGQGEQVRRVRRIPELVAGGLVDRHGPGAGGGIG